MIRLIRVETEHGITSFLFEYDLEEQILTLEINEREIIERAREFRELVGSNPTMQDLKRIVIQVVNEVKRGKRPFLEKYDYSKWIGVDLEAE